MRTWTGREAGAPIPSIVMIFPAKALSCCRWPCRRTETLAGRGGGRAGSVDSDDIFGNDAQLMQTTMQTDGTLDGANGGRAGFVDTDDIFGNGGSFGFSLKREELNIK